MWSFGSKAIASNKSPRPNEPPCSDCSESDDEISIDNNTQEEGEGLECPICCESFNIVENVPYVLLCGHTLCKNCVLGLQSSVVKLLPSFPIHLPFFISCPWCNNLSFRILYKGTLKFPRKNYFLVWMVESLNGDRVIKSHSSYLDNHHHHPVCQTGSVGPRVHHDPPPERLHLSLRKSLMFFVNLTAKFPLIFMFLVIVVYAIPASIAILLLYILVTILFAVPSFLVLYFAYPGLDWLVSEIVN